MYLKQAVVKFVTQQDKLNNGGWGEPQIDAEYVPICCVGVCVCALAPVMCVCLIGCVLEQVRQADVLLLRRALWALCERCYWMARGGCQLLWEGDEEHWGRGEWVSCLWKIWSAQVCERYCRSGTVWTGRGASSGT